MHWRLLPSRCGPCDAYQLHGTKALQTVPKSIPYIKLNMKITCARIFNLPCMLLHVCSECVYAHWRTDLRHRPYRGWIFVRTISRCVDICSDSGLCAPVAPLGAGPGVGIEFHSVQRYLTWKLWLIHLPSAQIHAHPQPYRPAPTTGQNENTLRIEDSRQGGEATDPPMARHICTDTTPIHWVGSHANRVTRFVPSYVSFS